MINMKLNGNTALTVDIVDATEQTYTYSVTMENIHYRWKLVVTVLNEKE